ncbi:MAG TPA: hypothetical protein VFM14_04475, partial [Gemmatimonadales bacterium]|nr:hypothetical protein [Gemmatimonadales bacterium]
GTAAEAGVPGAAALLVAGGLLLRTAWRRMRSRADHDAVLDGLTLACTLIVVACIGAVDSIIRTPAGGFLAFVILGLFAPRSDESLPLLRVALSRRVGILCLLLGLGPAVALSARQLASALVYGRDATPASLTRALALHPGDYRAHTLLARTLVEQHRCDLARPHIERARMLYPSATLPRQLWVRCTPGCSSPPPCLEVPGCE